jgi:ParB family transcriptional regulator, chromosome partitioning protein
MNPKSKKSLSPSSRRTPLSFESKPPSSHKGLGKGLGALLSSDGIPESQKDSVVNLKINDISPNADQPRKRFDESKLNELAESIKSNGIIIPIIVKKEGLGYKIVAGERRWRAAKIAGLALIPSIIRDLSDTEVMQQALIENIQRQDLNPVEEAHALERLIRQHRLTQDKLSVIIGKSRSAIANTLRLLNLPDEIIGMITNEDLSAGHARALLGLPDPEQQKKAAATILEREYSVRDTEKLVKHLLKPPKAKPSPDPQLIHCIKDFESQLSKTLSTKVKLRDKNKKGTILIEYYSYDDLDRIFDIISGASPRH